MARARGRVRLCPRHQAGARAKDPSDAQQGATLASDRPAEVDAIVVETRQSCPASISASTSTASPNAAERIELWKRKLLDLSKRNRLLNLRPSATMIPIFCPDPARLEDRIATGGRIAIIRRRSVCRWRQIHFACCKQETISPTDRPRCARPRPDHCQRRSKTLERGVLELFRKAKADLEEGDRTRSSWRSGRSSGAHRETMRSYRAPLILLPVRLERKSAAAQFRLTNTRTTRCSALRC